MHQVTWISKTYIICYYKISLCFFLQNFMISNTFFNEFKSLSFWFFSKAFELNEFSNQSYHTIVNQVWYFLGLKTQFRIRSFIFELGSTIWSKYNYRYCKDSSCQECFHLQRLHLWSHCLRLASFLVLLTYSKEFSHF